MMQLQRDEITPPYTPPRQAGWLPLVLCFLQLRSFASPKQTRQRHLVAKALLMPRALAAVWSRHLLKPGPLPASFRHQAWRRGLRSHTCPSAGLGDRMDSIHPTSPNTQLFSTSASHHHLLSLLPSCFFLTNPSFFLCWPDFSLFLPISHTQFLLQTSLAFLPLLLSPPFHQLLISWGDLHVLPPSQVAFLQQSHISFSHLLFLMFSHCSCELQATASFGSPPHFLLSPLSWHSCC